MNDCVPRFHIQCQGLGSRPVNRDLITRILNRTKDVKQRGTKDQDAGHISTPLCPPHAVIMIETRSIQSLPSG